MIGRRIPLIVSRYLTGIIPVHKLNIVILHGYIPSAHVISMENLMPCIYSQKYVGLAHGFKTTMQGFLNNPRQIALKEIC